MVYITDEMNAELSENPTGVRCEHATTQRVCFLVDESIYKEAMKAVRQRETIESIKRGMADFEAGRFCTPQEAYENTRETLGLPRVEA